ncbi:hypothetical protein YC2023_114355 [Brassica napus]
MFALCERLLLPSVSVSPVLLEPEASSEQAFDDQLLSFAPPEEHVTVTWVTSINSRSLHMHLFNMRITICTSMALKEHN